MTGIQRCKLRKKCWKEIGEQSKTIKNEIKNNGKITKMALRKLQKWI